ncbi:MAG: metal-dependent hydrolase [Lachnospiraceae bacterium]|jgi:inner membrane protein
MLGKTHMAVGIAATLAITQPSGVSELVLAVGAGSLGALISDIDVGTSNSHRDADKITALSVVVVLAVFAMDYFCNTQIIERIIGSSGYLRIIAGLLLFIGICAFGKEQPHRSFMHSFLALILLSFALGLIWEKAVIYFAVGFLSHLATDIFNKKKVRLLYPMKGGVSLGLFHAYGLANDIFFAIGSIVAIIEVIICIFFR